MPIKQKIKQTKPSQRTQVQMGEGPPLRMKYTTQKLWTVEPACQPLYHNEGLKSDNQMVVYYACTRSVSKIIHPFIIEKVWGWSLPVEIAPKSSSKYSAWELTHLFQYRFSKFLFWDFHQLPCCILCNPDNSLDHPLAPKQWYSKMVGGQICPLVLRIKRYVR